MKEEMINMYANFKGYTQEVLRAYNFLKDLLVNGTLKNYLLSGKCPSLDYIKYTILHKQAFEITEKAFNINAGLYYHHDDDKLVYYLSMSRIDASSLHRATAYHHSPLFISKNVCIEKALDCECAHLTKPDKFLSAYETQLKYKSNETYMVDILKDLGMWGLGNYRPITYEEYDVMQKSITIDIICENLKRAFKFMTQLLGSSVKEHRLKSTMLYPLCYNIASKYQSDSGDFTFKDAIEVANILCKQGYGLRYQSLALLQGVLTGTQLTFEQLSSIVNDTEFLQGVYFMTPLENIDTGKFVNNMCQNRYSAVVFGASRLQTAKKLNTTNCRQEVLVQFILQSKIYYCPAMKQLGSRFLGALNRELNRLYSCCTPTSQSYIIQELNRVGQSC